MVARKSKKEPSPYSISQIQFNLDRSPVKSLRHKTILREWVAECIRKEGFFPGLISYNFTTDKGLLAINQKYLNHNDYTDIITFELSEGNQISGDIYISWDRVKDNAEQMGETFHVELCRVMIHGVLHLCGYGDKSAKAAATMRSKENECLSLLSKRLKR